MSVDKTRAMTLPGRRHGPSGWQLAALIAQMPARPSRFSTCIECPGIGPGEWPTAARPVGVGLVPFVQIGRRSGPLLLVLDRALPGFIRLFDLLPVAALAQLVVWLLFAHGIRYRRPPTEARAVPPFGTNYRSAR